jgi:crossover junction endodeoxyribonuclease RuvC
VIIFGIDPGYATTGFGIIEFSNDRVEALDYGVITTKKDEIHGNRIKQTIDDLMSLIKEFKPDEIALEELFFSKNTKTALKVAESRGAILYALGSHKLLPTEYKPNQIKLNICGNGGAPKKQVQKMVQILLNLDSIPTPDDAADALAIAICHVNHIKPNIKTTQ